jgi:hypothetical protein
VAAALLIGDQPTAAKHDTHTAPAWARAASDPPLLCWWAKPGCEPATPALSRPSAPGGAIRPCLKSYAVAWKGVNDVSADRGENGSLLLSRERVSSTDRIRWRAAVPTHTLVSVKNDFVRRYTR